MSKLEFKPEDVIESARCIRFYLPDLVGEAAPQVDQQLAEWLAQAKAGENVSDPILDLLKGYPATRGWLAEFLSPKRSAKGYESLLGSSQVLAASKYTCPEGDYVWYRRSAGAAIPACPTHGVLHPTD
jgi:hypothetical protein